jgi:hypothetical protein
MARLHIKGRMLQLLQADGPLWDYELADRIGREYDQQGEYGYGNVRLTLADLSSNGLVETVQEKIDPVLSYGKEKLLLRYSVTGFGRERMADVGLMAGGAKS